MLEARQGGPEWRWISMARRLRREASCFTITGLRDIYMDVAEAYRGRGFGSFRVRS